MPNLERNIDTWSFQIFKRIRIEREGEHCDQFALDAIISNGKLLAWL